MKNVLTDLYQKISKHSQYQILPSILEAKIGIDVKQQISRYEEQRFDYMKQHLNFNKKCILDIGGNTGYFSVEAIQSGAKSAVLIEGNSVHAEFVRNIAEYLHFDIQVRNEYWSFNYDFKNEKFDIIFLLNVIHHVGDDFDARDITLNEAKQQMKYALNNFIGHTDFIVLQFGFCWKGDRNFPLFQNGTKREMILFVEEIVSDHWIIESIGVASEIDGGITKYVDVNSDNIERIDHLGEFRNRPIFILKVK